LQVTTLPETVERAGMLWLHLPIPDGGVPDGTWEMAWDQASRALRSALTKGSRIVIHCKGGLGRTGLVASLLLVESGIDARTAMRMVRETRPGAIETVGQEQYIIDWERRLKGGSAPHVQPPVT